MQVGGCLPEWPPGSGEKLHFLEDLETSEHGSQGGLERSSGETGCKQLLLVIWWGRGREARWVRKGTDPGAGEKRESMLVLGPLPWHLER